MKKLITLLLVLTGYVSTASAWWDCMYIRYEGHWSDTGGGKFNQINPSDGASNEYYIRLDGSKIRGGDFCFRISYDDAGHSEYRQWQPGEDKQEITTTKYVTNYEGSTNAFCIKQDSKAAEVEIYLKWENSKWSITALVLYNNTIHWKNNHGWSTVKAYTWDGTGDHRTIYALGAIGDVASLTEIDGLYSVSFLGSSSVKAMFLEHKDGNKTTNLNVVNNGVYQVWDSANPYGIKVNITDAGYATFSSMKAVDFSELTSTIVAKKASLSGATVSYEDVTYAAANEGVLLKSVSGKAVSGIVKLHATQSIAKNSGNAFVAIDRHQKLSQTDGDNTNYILAKPSTELGFFKVNSLGSYVNAGTAYLQVPTASVGAREFFALDDETTSIDKIETKSSVGNEKFYNLAGQRVAQPNKGLYIVNGKKVVIK